MVVPYLGQSGAYRSGPCRARGCYPTWPMSMALAGAVMWKSAPYSVKSVRPALAPFSPHAADTAGRCWPHKVWSRPFG